MINALSATQLIDNIEKAPLPQGVAFTSSMPDTQPLDRDEQRWSALMVSSQNGCEADYRILLSELSEAINRYLRSRIGHHNYIEDCVQDCLIAIHQARHTYDSRRLFRPWLFAIVRNKAIDSLRHQRSYKLFLEKEQIDQELKNYQRQEDAEPCQQLEDNMTQGKLIQALAPKYREAIVLTKIIGLSTKEAASKLKIAETTLKVRVHRGISRLKKSFAAEAL
ncbi:MAG: sigma-70 family RNA polymerase sigma factor [Pseudomonadales bacterium]|nr:sigma-70 family RNA polymerase sigma factor [Pseudomonadales bacterium]